MTKGIDHYFQTIRDEAYVDVYAADNTAMLTYPYRLGRPDPDESSPTVANNSESFILDSGIGDDTHTNETVLERAEYLDADMVVPKDVFGDPEATTPQVLEMLNLVEELDGYDPTVMIPVQHTDGVTHADHYRVIEDVLSEQGYDIRDYPVALGGLNKSGIVEQVDAVTSVREVAGDEQHIHGLGFGASRNWVVIIQQNPDLLDSLDISTYVQSVTNGTIHDIEFNRLDFPSPRGKASTSLSATLRDHQLHMLNYLMSPLVRDTDRPQKLNSEPPETIAELERLLA